MTPAELAGSTARWHTAAHVFVADVDRPVLMAADRDHLQRSLRLRPGELVGVSDGKGAWRPCRWQSESDLDPIGPVETSSPVLPPVTVAVSVVKGERSEWAVQKLTELGVDRIVPLFTARTVVRWDAVRARHGVERWRRVARAASMQSRRLRLPTVSDPATFADLAGAGRARGVALAVAGGGPPSLAWPTVLVGPEGGWSPEELGRDLPQVGLGTEMLRTETAAVAAGALLAAMRAGTVASATGPTAPTGPGEDGHGDR